MAKPERVHHVVGTDETKASSQRIEDIIDQWSGAMRGMMGRLCVHAPSYREISGYPNSMM